MRCPECGEFTVPYGGEDVCECPPERRCQDCWAVEDACVCDYGPSYLAEDYDVLDLDGVPR